MKDKKIKAAFVGFGEVNSPQELIKDKCLKARKEIESIGIETVTTDHVTDDSKGVDVNRAITDLKTDEFDPCTTQLFLALPFDSQVLAVLSR